MEAALWAGARRRASIRLFIQAGSRWISDIPKLKQQTVEECRSEEKPGVWKWLIRKRVWDSFSLPLYRFPNFDGVKKASDKLGTLPEYRKSNCVYVSTDTPQKPVRTMILTNKKQMLVSQLPKGLFSLLDPTHMSETQFQEACTQAEFRIAGSPVGLDDRVRVNMIVIGSVAVDPKTGARLGKGDGYAELEYAMLRYIGAAHDRTLVVTTVDDKQLVNDIPVEKLFKYDLPVDIICTPTKIIHTRTTIPKPTEILWEELPRTRLIQIRVLRELKKKIEKKTGQVLKLAKSERAPHIDHFRNGPAIFITDINPTTTKEELKQHLMKLGVTDITRSVVFKTESSKSVGRVVVPKEADIDKYVEIINNSKLKGWLIKARRDRFVEEDPLADANKKAIKKATSKAASMI